jgi:hypothetical protein
MPFKYFVNLVKALAARKTGCRTVEKTPSQAVQKAAIDDKSAQQRARQKIPGKCQFSDVIKPCQPQRNPRI